MAFSSGSSSSFSADINVTPLIDVLLVLLIIFMVIVPVLPRGIDSAVPQDHHNNAVDAPSLQLVVQILGSPQGAPPHYRLNQHDVQPGELRSTLQGIFALRQDRTLFVQGDRDLNYGEVAEAVGEGRAAGASTVALVGAPLK